MEARLILTVELDAEEGAMMDVKVTCLRAHVLHQ